MMSPAERESLPAPQTLDAENLSFLDSKRFQAAMKKLVFPAYLKAISIAGTDLIPTTAQTLKVCQVLPLPVHRSHDHHPLYPPRPIPTTLRPCACGPYIVCERC